jgi:hypothetical protein
VTASGRLLSFAEAYEPSVRKFYSRLLWTSLGMSLPDPERPVKIGGNMSAFVSNADICPSGFVPCFRNVFRRDELAHISEPTRPRAIAPARAQPWQDAPIELEPDYDPLAQPEPEMELAHRIQW